MLTATFSRVMRVSIRADVSSASSMDQSACTLDVIEIVIVVTDATLKEDVAHLAPDTIFLMDN